MDRGLILRGVTITKGATPLLTVDHHIRPGEVLLLEAFGGGFTWGSVLLKY